MFLHVCLLYFYNRILVYYILLSSVTIPGKTKANCNILLQLFVRIDRIIGIYFCLTYFKDFEEMYIFVRIDIIQAFFVLPVLKIF